MVIDVLVEGLVDEAVAQRLIRHTGHRVGTTYGKQGAAYLRQKVAGFNVRARYGNPILLLVDFVDTKLACPPEVPAVWLSEQDPKLLLRVVVREIESWLLADQEGVAKFLGLSLRHLPPDPENLDDPKQTLVNLARRSRRRRVQDAIVPRPGISAVVGTGYTDTMIAFVLEQWNIEAARHRSHSLDHCLRRLAEVQL